MLRLMDLSWQELLQQYQSLDLASNLDYDKFNHYAITHHSTQIEGSTLTETETRLLLEQQLTPGGKPLAHSLMVQDHYEALQFVLQVAAKKGRINEGFIKQINAAVLRQTGAVYRTIFGDIDSSKGEYRKNNVSAGSRYFVNYSKVEALTLDLAQQLDKQLDLVTDSTSQLTLSFDAHFDLVSIHPFYDGNGRTARLLMNFIQHYFGLPLSIVFTEDKSAYFEALEQTRKAEDLSFFRNFMLDQYAKYLQNEIVKYQKMNTDLPGKKRFSFIF